MLMYLITVKRSQCTIRDQCTVEKYIMGEGSNQRTEQNQQDQQDGLAVCTACRQAAHNDTSDPCFLGVPPLLMRLGVANLPPVYI